MSKSTLSSVVSNLVRASMGSSVSDSVPDDDLDRHVAELILKEAKQKAERYGSEGYKAYLPGNTWSESNAPKTNKRFLSSIIKNTDDHNKTILRAQALAAQEVRNERLEQEKKERRARAEEAVEAERLRRLMGKGGAEWGRSSGKEKRDRDRKRRERSWERRDDEQSDRDDLDDRKGKGRERTESRRDDRERERERNRRSRSPTDDDYERRRRRHRSRRERSRSPRSSRYSDDEDEVDRRDRRHRSHRESRSHRSRSREHRHRSRRDDTGHDRHRRRRRDEDVNRGSPKTLDVPEDEDTPAQKESDPEPASPVPIHGGTDSDGLPSTPRRRKREDAEEDVSRKRPCSMSPESRPRSVGRSGQEEDADEQTAAPSDTKAEEDALRRQFDDKVAELRAKLSTSKRTVQSRASSSRHRDRHEVGASSSHTPRDFSPSPGPHPPSSPSEKSSRSKRSRHKAKGTPPPPPSSAPPPLPAHLPSKMDKYFEESYDPRLDVAPLSAPSIPATGLISDAEFAGWDAMLEIIRRRREDKEEKKQLERMGIGKDKSRDGKKSRAGDTSEAADIMAIEYKKRGAVREWDLGKEGF